MLGWRALKRFFSSKKQPVALIISLSSEFLKSAIPKKVQIIEFSVSVNNFQSMESDLFIGVFFYVISNVEWIALLF